MALANKCDRCGKFYTRPYTPELKVIQYMHGYGERTIDLCDDCLKGLVGFLGVNIDLSNPFGEVMDTARSSSALRKKIEVGKVEFLNKEN